MDEEASVEKTRKLLKLQLDAEKLCRHCESHQSINGMTKLLRKSQAEKKFLLKLSEKKEKICLSHSMNSSNLMHLQGVAVAVETFTNVTHVLRRFYLPRLDYSLVVDVICNHGYMWVKVIARNSKALQLDMIGQHDFGEKTVIDQAREYFDLAQLYPHNFVIPEVVFLFFYSVPRKLQKSLKKIGVRCQVSQDVFKIQTIADTNESHEPEEKTCFLEFLEEISIEAECQPCDEKTKLSDRIQSIHIKDINICPTISSAVADVCEFPKFCDDSCVCSRLVENSSIVTEDTNFLSLNKVNMDVTTMVTLVSNVCHGRSNLIFKEDVLTQQAAEERAMPVLPGLIRFLRGKKMHICESALRDFQSILSVIGGENEKRRADILLGSISVVPDCSSPRSEVLNISSKISQRAKVVFGTGDSLQAVTTTANSGFVRASAQFGVDFVVYVHPARALTEQKEATAMPFNKDAA